MWYLWVTYQSAGDGSLSDSHAEAALSPSTAPHAQHTRRRVGVGAGLCFVLSNKLSLGRVRNRGEEWGEEISACHSSVFSLAA